MATGRSSVRSRQKHRAHATGTKLAVDAVVRDVGAGIDVLHAVPTYLALKLAGPLARLYAANKAQAPGNTARPAAILLRVRISPAAGA